MQFFTSLDSFVDDVATAIRHIEKKHNGQTPVLVGHSLGGGIVQYLLSTRDLRAPGLILLAAAPLKGGGKDIAYNWQQIEAPEGYEYPWSSRARLNTIHQVKSVFFCPECPDEVVDEWLKESRAPEESARAGLSVVYEFGNPEKILDHLDGLKGSRKKVLLVAGEKDLLVKPEMVKENADAYRSIDPEAVEEKVVTGSAHHIMWDLHWAQCADFILEWLE
jgi:pimeloyl-ACP methyl ester carboxylesterase